MTRTFRDDVRVIVLTISDRCAAGVQADRSGPAVTALLRAAGLREIDAATLPDEQAQIVEALRAGSARAELIVTTGGTGIAPRDVTPEATRAVCDRIIDGFAERMRAVSLSETAMAPLSRAVCGIISRSDGAGGTLVVNLPGSLNGARTCLAAVLDLLPHALDLIAGCTAHDAPRGTDDGVRSETQP